MRRIGGELTEQQAGQLSQFLFTEGIPTVVEQAADGSYDLSARDEDDLQRAREELGVFLSDPSASRFRVQDKAEAMRREQEKIHRERMKLQKKFKPAPAGRFAGRATPITIGIIAICVLMSLVTNFGTVTQGDRVRNQGRLPLSGRIYETLTLLPTNVPEDAGPLWAVAQGQVWRLLTPLFLHGSIMHLLFNGLFVYSFGRIVEMLFGSVFMLALFLIGGIVGLFAQAYGPVWFGGSPNVIGASGGAFALFSFLWLRPMVEPTLPFRMSPLSVIFILGVVMLSMLPTRMFTEIANLAHLGGLIFGAMAAVGAIDFLRR